MVTGVRGVVASDVPDGERGHGEESSADETGQEEGFHARL
jgi:hypothetical protein